MPDNSATLHESNLSRETVDMHRAIVSLMEELEAVDWYRQRSEATSNPELKEILQHNMREEMEHASMVLEWIRRNNGDFDEHLKTYLFTQKPILDIEDLKDLEEVEVSPKTKLTVGTLKGM